MRKIYLLLFPIIIICILTNSRLALYYANTGLQLWFYKMLPALLPFMILSGIMIRMHLTNSFTTLLYPVLHPLFRASGNVCYAILMGFLCGFPMGAKTVADLLEADFITEKEGEYLLAFCNNIGPVYFCSFALPLLERRMVLPYLLGMYGIPFLYGILLRRTKYRNLGKEGPCYEKPPINVALETTNASCAPQPILQAMDEAITSSMQSILSLCGYMVICNLCNLLPHLLLGESPRFLAPLLEITGGLSLCGAEYPLYALLALSFGGFSCLAQTYSCIRKTRLSLTVYCIHKFVILGLTILFYLGWFLLFPDTFLR